MLIYGKNVAKEALKKNENIKHIYLSEQFHEDMILKQIEESKLPFSIVNKSTLNTMVKGNHQGIILEVKAYEYTPFSDFLATNPSFVVLLDHLEDPHNFGAIIRTCEAAGVEGILIPKDRSVDVTGTVTKVSAGAINNIKMVQVTNLVDAMKKLKKENFWIVGTDMTGQSYETIDYQGKCAIVIGNEGKGISRLVEENCDFMASIPMKGKINSLNASVAAGIVIFEAAKQRR